MMYICTIYTYVRTVYMYPTYSFPKVLWNQPGGVFFKKRQGNPQPVEKIIPNGLHPPTDWFAKIRHCALGSQPVTESLSRGV